MATNQDINDALKGNYLLCTLSISRWGAAKRDDALAAETAGNHGASPEAVRVTKKIMAGADSELNDVNKTLNSIRSYLYAVSLPWSNAGDGAKKGPRLIPTATAMEIIARLSALQAEFKQAMAALKSVYDQRVQEAMAKQGTLADPTLYPDKSELDEMFRVTMDFTPVPTVTDFSRMSLPTNVAEALGGRMAKRQSKVVENAMADAMRRTADVVSNMAKQLAKHAAGEKTRLYTSLVDNVKIMADLLASTNLTNDPAITDLAEQVRKLTEYDIKTLKANLGTANDVARKAQQLTKHPAFSGNPQPTLPEPEPEPEPEAPSQDRESDSNQDAQSSPQGWDIAETSVPDQSAEPMVDDRDLFY